MHVWTQNLNERGGKITGSIFSHGRGHITRKPFQGVTLGAEWLFFHRVGWRFGVGFDTGHSDCDDGFMFHFSLPWLCSIYLYIDGIFRVKEARCFDFYISDRRIKFTPWGRTFDWRSEDPWWIKGLSWDLPWASEWIFTRVLTLDGSRIVWEENRKQRRNKSDPFASMRVKDEVKKNNSQQFSYRYVRKSGEVQERTATVCVEEMAWGYKWWRFPVNVRRSIDVAFDGEVGEGTGSWKGGTVGCGYEMLPSETVEQCFRRMERDQKFER